MAKAKGPAGAAAPLLAPRVVGYVGYGLSCAAAAACGVLAVVGVLRGSAGGALLLRALLFLPVALLGWALFHDFVRLKDWAVAPEVPLGLKLLGNLGRVVGSLGAASCVALAVMTAVLPKEPQPGLAALFVLGIFVSMLVRTLGAAIAELRTWARPGSLAVTGFAVALLVVALIFNLTKWKAAGATLPLALFLGSAAVLFLFLLVYLNLPPVVDAFESRRL
ncbi:MAG TPA: hypothetical protein VNE39_00480 [Planctomycetota bacterium]|nr:hypothetical protein [Planctomycetota bacterium]